MNNTIWAIPKQEDIRKKFWNVVEQHFGNKAIDILEIGVFRAGCLAAMPSDKINVNSYTGIDPFDDSVCCYYSDKAHADYEYECSKKIFEEKNAMLYRMTSEEFREKSDEVYDFIYVDGNHKFQEALFDMCMWFQRVKTGGIMMVDDYGNRDCPEVTLAVNSFIALYRNRIARMGLYQTLFQNGAKYLPVNSENVYFEKGDYEFNKTYTVSGYSSLLNELKEYEYRRRLCLWGGANSSMKILSLNEEDIEAIVLKDEKLVDEEIFKGKEILFADNIKNWSELFLLIPTEYFHYPEMKDFLTKKGMSMGKDYIRM